MKCWHIWCDPSGRGHRQLHYSEQQGEIIVFLLLQWHMWQLHDTLTEHYAQSKNYVQL